MKKEKVFICHFLISLFCTSARRGRVYLPQDELAQAGLSDEDIFAGKVTDKWRTFMKNQIKRARLFFDEAEKGVTELNSASRWPVSDHLPITPNLGKIIHYHTAMPRYIFRKSWIPLDLLIPFCWTWLILKVLLMLTHLVPSQMIYKQFSNCLRRL